MINRKVRVGVIGVGRMGERHCRIYSKLAGVEFVGVSDQSPTRGASIASAYDVAFYPSFEDLIDEVDAVSIATTTTAHFSVALACLQRGRHLLVEKPLAARLDEARELARLADQAPVVFQVGHIERFNPVLPELQCVLEDLTVLAITAQRLSPFDTSNTDVDVVFDLMIHDIDLALTLLGDRLTIVSAGGASARTSSVDYAVATLSDTNGSLATLTASRITEQKVRTLDITALGAYVQADLLSKTISIHRRTFPEYLSNHQRPPRYRQESLVEQIHVPSAEPLLLELQDFIRCIREGVAPRVSAEDGLRTVELAQEIRDQLDRPRRSRTALAVPVGA